MTLSAKHVSAFAAASMFLAGISARADVALPADSFVDRIGVNTHMSGGSFDLAKFGDLGVRHFRDNLAPSTTGTAYTRSVDLYNNYGIKLNVVCDSTAASRTPTLYQTFMKTAHMESIEGLNEPDLFGPRSYGGFTDNWTTQTYPATLQYQTELYNLMKGDSQTSGKPVYSPAMGDPAKALRIAGTPCNFLSMHSYPGGQLPTGNSLDTYQITGTQLMGSGGVSQIVATETGYMAGGSSGDVSDAAGAKYLPRLYAEYFNRNVTRTYDFEMMDTPGVYDYGLFRSDLTAKPAYTNLKNLIYLLEEGVWNTGSKVWSVPNFGPGVLDYTMSTSSPNVHRTLLQKSNGEFYLLLWQELPSYSFTTHSDIVNPTVPVTLTFNTPILSASTFQLGSLTPTATYSGPTTLALNVPDEILVLRLVPNTGYVPPSGTAVSIAATDGSATQNPVTTGSFTISRTGSTTAALTVNYSVGGTAIGGTDYTTLPGSVTIPAGAASAPVTVTPSGMTTGQGAKNVIVTLGGGTGYSVAANRTALVQLTMGNGNLDDFEDANITMAPHQWTRSTRSTLSLVSPGDNSNYALRWDYNDDGATQWTNEIFLNFPSAQDWRGVSKVRIRFAEDAANPASDIGQRITFDYANNGSRVNGGGGVTTFSLSGSTTYRTLDFDLARFPRDKVNYMMFYVDGNAYATGDHIFYIDNITALTDSGGVLADFEASGTTNWSGTPPRSTISLNSANADSGAYALKWLYNDNGTRWGNEIALTFATAQDWSRNSKLVLRFKVDAANPAADNGKLIYMDWRNNGSSVSGGSGAASFALNTSTDYRTISLNLGNFNRDKVTRLTFYVDGDSFASGDHIWYLDNMTLF